MKKIRVAVNGYGVIGKRVADAVALQDDMELIGICDVSSDWRIKMTVEKKHPIFAFEHSFGQQMTAAGIPVQGNLDELIAEADVIVDCTPKSIAARNIEKDAAASIKKTNDTLGITTFNK